MKILNDEKDKLDTLEQYTRTNSLEILGVPKKAYSSTKVGVDTSSNCIEIGNRVQ